MNELFIGIVFILVSLFLGKREFDKWNKLKNDDYMRKSFSVKTIGALITLLIAGFISLYHFFN